MTPRSCIFCGGTPLTNEHAIARWLAAVLDDIELAGAKWQLAYEYGTPGATKSRNHPMPIPTVVVGTVCAECNGGWMSRLEGAAKPLLEAMVRGQRVHLTPANQLVVATWAVKTVMVLEFYRAELHVNSAADRDLVREEQRPPAHYRVRLASIAPSDQPLRHQTFVATTELPDGSPNVLCSTLLIGAVVVQAWGGPGADDVNLARQGTKTGTALMIWPPTPSSAEWPPARELAAVDVEAFLRGPTPERLSEGYVSAWPRS